MTLQISLTTVTGNAMQPIMPLLHDPVSGACACIDPADADLALSVAKRNGWSIDRIFVTHHHNDHTAGVRALKEATGAQVWGPANEAVEIAGLDHKLTSRDWVSIGAHRAMVYECPGHTRGHITFHFNEDDLFVAGDTLFVLGCGRLTEGSPADMWGYLKQLRTLPPQTRLLCGHDYTAGNIAFTRSIVGDSAALSEFERAVAEQGSIPGLMATEQALNLFLKADDPAIARALDRDGAEAVDVFAELRGRKDRF